MTDHGSIEAIKTGTRNNTTRKKYQKKWLQNLERKSEN
jgi:hypothetical protein